MEDDKDDDHRALVGWILGIAVTIAVTVALTSGVVALSGGDAPAAAPAAQAAPAAPAAEAPAATPAAPAAAPVAKLYFASGAAALPADAAALLAPIVEAAKAKAGSKVAISGFHDKTGNPEQNAELAKQRAFAVRDALLAAGVAEAAIELRKPTETEGGADDREARRVEVSVE